MEVTFELPEDMFLQINPLREKLPQILELGLRELNATSQSGFSGVAEVLEFLASLPTPEAIVDLRPSATLQTQISELLQKNRTVGLNSTEEELWQGYQYLEHIVRIAKARALVKLQEARSVA